MSLIDSTGAMEGCFQSKYVYKHLFAANRGRKPIFWTSMNMDNLLTQN